MCAVFPSQWHPEIHRPLLNMVTENLVTQPSSGRQSRGEQSDHSDLKTAHTDNIVFQSDRQHLFQQPSLSQYRGEKRHAVHSPFDVLSLNANLPY